jgi:hypothetical protein
MSLLDFFLRRRYVTLQMAVCMSPGNWIPQGTVFRLVRGRDDHLFYRGKLPDSPAIYMLPRIWCSEPRSKP